MKSIKIDEDVYNELKRLKGDKTFNEALKQFIEAAKKTQETVVKQYYKQISNITDIAKDISQYLISMGYFDIRVKDIGIKDVNYYGDGILIHGYIYISIPNEDVRKAIFDKIVKTVGGSDVR